MDLDRLDELTRQISIAPHNADLRFEAGQIMLRNGQETEGLRWLASALQEDPSHAAAMAEYQEHAGGGKAASPGGAGALAGSTKGPERDRKTPWNLSVRVVNMIR